jgi:aspartokinase
MSQLEQLFRDFLARHPEIRAAGDFINIRAVARKFIEEEGLPGDKIEAAVAMIRRSDIAALESHVNREILSNIRISIKDEIVILDYEKSKGIVEALKEAVSLIDYDKNDTLKVAIGSHNVKIIVDASKSEKIKDKLGGVLREEHRSISEISIMFPESAYEEKGVVAYFTSQLLLNGINIREILTCTPELIVYVDEKQSVKAYDVFKRIKADNIAKKTKTR